MKNSIYEKSKKLPVRMKFLLGVLLLYSSIFPFDHDLALQSLSRTLLMLAKVVPILAIVFLVMAGVNLLIGSGKMIEYLGKKAGIGGWIYTMIAGILVSGPPYLLYPLLKELKDAGMREQLIAVFLYNRNVKIPYVPAMAFYFGWTYTLVFSSYIIAFSILNGLAVHFLLGAEESNKGKPSQSIP